MRIIKAILDFFFPRYCVMCGNRLELEEWTICLHCNFDLPRTFLWKSPTDNDLAKRFWGKIPVEKAAAYLDYYSQSLTANIVYAFKYQGEPYTATYMGEMMAKEIDSEFFDGIDCLIPVPISSRRMRKRKYNQSEKLAQGIQSVLHIPIHSDIVKKNKDNMSQTLLDKFERLENIEQTFKLTKHAHKIAGKHCLIIDDVITTGATTIGCARQVLKIPGTKVSILSLAWVKNKK